MKIVSKWFSGAGCVLQVADDDGTPYTLSFPTAPSPTQQQVVDALVAQRPVQLAPGLVAGAFVVLLPVDATGLPTDAQLATDAVPVGKTAVPIGAPPGSTDEWDAGSSSFKPSYALKDQVRHGILKDLVFEAYLADWAVTNAGAAKRNEAASTIAALQAHSDHAWRKVKLTSQALAKMP